MHRQLGTHISKVRSSYPQVITSLTSLPLSFKMAQHLGLRCVLLPAPLLLLIPGGRNQNTSRIKNKRGLTPRFMHRSLTLDQWSEDMIEVVKGIGNDRSNALWLAKTAGTSPLPTYTGGEQFLLFRSSGGGGGRKRVEKERMERLWS